jgi:ketopantoate reductase
MAKIAVVGCGAMGSVYAALMVDAGHEVHAVTLWPDHAEAMATNGLRCEGASGDRTVPIHASAAKRVAMTVAAMACVHHGMLSCFMVLFLRRPPGREKGGI